MIVLAASFLSVLAAGLTVGSLELQQHTAQLL